MASEPCCSHEVGKRISVTLRREMVVISTSVSKRSGSKERNERANCNPFRGVAATDADQLQACRDPPVGCGKKKKAPGNTRVPGGQRTPFFSGSDWTLRSLGNDQLFSEAVDGFHAERSLRGPQSASTPGADSTTWIKCVLCRVFQKSKRVFVTSV